MGKIKTDMVCSYCHAKGFEQIDWLKKGTKKEEVNLTLCNTFLNFVKLGNSEFIR